MITLAEYSVDEIIPIIGFGMPSVRLETNNGLFKVRVSSVRLECFKRNLRCVDCGIVGDKFKLQINEKGPKFTTNCFIENCPWCELKVYKTKTYREKPHLNLFAKNRFGQLILMTRDHIMPRSKGGSEDISNMQTMCFRCNQNKGDKLPFDIAA